MEEPNNDIDTETLQAQIDLSMAYAQNLVASWLTPSSTSLINSSSSRTAETEAELQALLRRPPRLGVGAPLPETPAPAQTRLVQRLEGGKRRALKMENGALAETATTCNDGRNEQEGEDNTEEESRVASASAVRKRPRVVDPFEPAGGGKGKKKMKKADLETTAAETEEVVKAILAKVVAVEEALPMMASVNAATNPMSKKRKKKKKKKNMEMETQLLPEGRNEEGQTQGEKAHVVALGGPVGEPRSTDRSAEGPAQLYPVVTPLNVDATMSPKPPRGSSLSTLSARQSPTTSGLSTHPTYSPPILNLTGLPPPAPEEPEGSPHKKRRRKRKKKKSTGGQGTETDPP